MLFVQFEREIWIRIIEGLVAMDYQFLNDFSMTRIKWGD